MRHRGGLSQTYAESCAPARLTGIDSSAGYLETARRRLGPGLAELREGDAQSLPLPTRSFDRVVSGLVLNFVPDPRLAAAELLRVARPGGEIALYVWDYGDRMELMRHFRDAAATLDPAAEALDEGKRFPLCRPEPLRRLFEGAGVMAVETRPFDVPTPFRDFEDYWWPFLGGQGAAPAYCMSLTEGARTTLRDRLRVALAARPDGSIHLTARAWAVRGRKG